MTSSKIPPKTGCSVLAVCTETFERVVLDHPGPVLVDFCSRMCGPCKIMESILELLANDLAEYVKIVKVDVDEHPELADLFKIQSVPALTLIAEGRLAGQWIGYHSEKELRAELTNALGLPGN